jgi:hypothetical protein
MTRTVERHWLDVFQLASVCQPYTPSLCQETKRSYDSARDCNIPPLSTRVVRECADKSGLQGISANGRPATKEVSPLRLDSK